MATAAMTNHTALTVSPRQIASVPIAYAPASATATHPIPRATFIAASHTPHVRFSRTVAPAFRSSRSTGLQAGWRAKPATRFEALSPRVRRAPARQPAWRPVLREDYGREAARERPRERGRAEYALVPRCARQPAWRPVLPRRPALPRKPVLRYGNRCYQPRRSTGQVSSTVSPEIRCMRSWYAIVGSM